MKWYVLLSDWAQHLKDSVQTNPVSWHPREEEIILNFPADCGDKGDFLINMVMSYPEFPGKLHHFPQAQQLCLSDVKSSVVSGISLRVCA